MAEPITPPRLVVIGLDGATWDVIGPALESGKLPALRGLMDGGALVDSDLTFPPVPRSLNELLVRVGVMEAKLLPGQLWGTSLLCVC